MTKQVKVIAFEWNVPNLIDVLVELSKQHNWQTVYCVSHNQEGRVRQHFPDAIYHNTLDARYGRPAPQLANLPWSGLDQPTAEALGYVSLLAMKQMDRMEIMGGFATHDRFLHLHRVASYWTAVLDRLQPDVLLMPTAPHVVYDYVAYALAKRRGIRTVMFEYVTTEGLMMAIDSYEDGLPPLTRAYRRLLADPPNGDVVLSNRMEAYLQRLGGDYEQAIPAWTRYVRDLAEAARAAQAREREAEARAKAAAEAEAVRLAELAAQQLAKAKAARAARAEAACAAHAEAVRAAEARRAAIAAKPLNRALRLFGLQPIAAVVPEPVPGNLAPEPDIPAPALEIPKPTEPVLPPPPGTDGHYGGRFFAEAEVPVDLARRAAEYRRQHHETMSQRYNELAAPADLSKPYIYVALHLQPERSTNPLGGVFDDQYVMVGMISSVLPPGWQVYVKEHPTQFAPQFASERGRWTTLYETLVSIPNVTLVSRDTPSFDLIDNARAVATITGTSSWEAIVRRKPTLVFGEPWYKGCPGSYTVRTFDDCRQALTKIAAGERPDPAATRLFLKAAEDASFPGYLSTDEAPLAGIDEATNLQTLTRAIAECYAASSDR